MILQLEGEDVPLEAHSPASHYITFRKLPPCCASWNIVHVGGSLAACGAAIVAALRQKWVGDDAAVRPCP
jgi:hypothetical protein